MTHEKFQRDILTAAFYSIHVLISLFVILQLFSLQFMTSISANFTCTLNTIVRNNK